MFRMAIPIWSIKSPIFGHSPAIRGRRIRTGNWWKHEARIERSRFVAVKPLFKRTIIFLLLLGVASCAPEPKKVPTFSIEPVSFSELPGWQRDNQAEALPALRASCKKFKAGRGNVGTKWIAISVDHWQGPCNALPPANASTASARAYFEQWFRPYRVSGPKGEDGLFTGYFEAELTGSRRRENASQIPLYGLPRDHVSVDLSKFDPKLTGKKIVGRVEGRRLVPYHKRGAIDAGALSNQGVELIWADDQIDLYLLHVQGSGRVQLRDGSVLRVGFAGHNGHGYRSIGRVLIRRGELRKGGASWPDIRRWIEQNPGKARALLAENPRFIFFRSVRGQGPIGAQGVALTPGRSLAVDRRYLPFGAPVWLTTHWPNDESRPLRLLMVAQDTGAAIKGPDRGDFFWGHGKGALRYAGSMKGQGRYFVLLPRDWR
ncbi:MAG TPA: murein transglycosylase [Rhodospirillaceae bacterium]|nr:murein transglycosylase [Rhodospirillaceae bacterium]